MRPRFLSSLLLGGISLLAGAIQTQAATLTVTNNSDTGTGSLRQAIADANNESAYPGADVIQFASDVTGSITLATGLPILSSAIDIQGPGAGALTVERSSSSGTPSFSIFHIGTSTHPIAIQGLTVARGEGHTGGGVWGHPQSTSIFIKNCVFRGNKASGGGGGGVGYASRIVNTLFQDNISTYREGGGYRGAGTLINCTFQNNSSVANGGGVYATGAAALVNCTFSGNSAPQGGAAEVGPNASISHCTFGANTATSGAGALLSANGAPGHAGAVLRLDNSIFLGTGSTSTANFSTLNGGSFASRGYNIFQGSTVPFTSHPSDQVGVDPLLSPSGLQNNGGLVPTIAIAENSPAVDAGESVLRFDARDLARPTGGTNDIGAFEVNATLPVQSGQAGPDFVVNETGDAGDGVCGADSCTLREAVNAANEIGDASRITFTDNVRGTLTLAGGQLSLSSPVTIVGPGPQQLALSGNDATRHFNVESGMAAAISGLTLRDGRATDNGPVPMDVTRSGGSIYNLGTLTLTDCTLDNNRAIGLPLSSYSQFGGFGRGGAIVNEGSLTLRGCTLSNNLAQGGMSGGGGIGGAILSGSQPENTLFLENCTLSGNVARGTARSAMTNQDGSARGGAIIVSRGTGTFNFVTIANNLSQSGSNSFGGEAGGLLVNNFGGAPGGATATAQNCLFANNEIRSLNAITGQGPDVSGTLGGNYNVVGQAANATLSGSNNKVGVGDAKLGALSFNGGSTQTLPLLPGSPAINAGRPGPYYGINTDQRGMARPQVNRFDVGAFELPFIPTESLVVNTLKDEDDGASDPTLGTGTSLREAINFANSNPDANSISFDPAVFNGPKTIVLTINSLGLAGPLSIASPVAGTLTITRSTATGTPKFGILYVGGTSGSVTLDGLIISGGNEDYEGAAVRNGGTLFLQNCQLTGNNSMRVGGGLHNEGTATLRFCTISGNTSGLRGGGIYNSDGVLSLANCAVTGNSSSSGGGIYNEKGQISLSNCTIAGNNSSYEGGGIANNSFSSNISLQNCTVVGNSARERGGGIYAPEFGGASYGGFSSPPPSTTASGTLIALNSIGSSTNVSGADVWGRFISQNYNLVGDADGATGFTQSNDQTGTSSTPHDARIELSAGKPVLKDNGGPTQTVALLVGSSAINAGNPALGATATAYDQRGEGFARVKYGRVDVGAFELQNVPPGTLSISLSPTSLKTDGVVTATPLVLGGDSNTLTYSFQWKKNGQILSGQTSDTLDLKIAGNGDKGDKISVIITARDTQGGTITGESESLTIQNSTPVIRNVAITPKNPSADSKLALSIETLTDADGDPFTVSYQWLSYGNIIQGETQSTLNLSNRYTSTGERIQSRLSVSDGQSVVLAESDTVTIAEPLINSATLTGSSPFTYQNLGVNISREGSEPLSYTYEWMKNDVAIAGETGATLDLSKPGNGDRGDRISVKVTASKSDGQSMTVISDTAVVANSAPFVFDVYLNSPKTNDRLSISGAQTTDSDGDILNTTYQWKRNGQNIVGQIASTLDLSKPGNGDKGDKISVIVTVSDGTSSGTRESGVVTVDNSLPTLNGVRLAPTLAFTNTLLQASASASDADGDSTSLTYIWKNGDKVLAGEVGSTLNLAKAGIGDKGDRISVTIVPREGQYSGPSATASITVGNSLPTLGTATFNGRENQVLSSHVAGKDADNETLIYSRVAAPRYGTLALQSSGAFTYSPRLNWHGTDSFTTRVVDGSGASATATFTLNIAPMNGVPLAVADVVKGTEDVPLSIAASTLLVNDRNGENAGETDALRVIKVVGASGFPGTLTFDLARQTIVFTPKLNWSGTTTFTYTVQDSAGATATAQVTLQIAPLNDAPVALPAQMTVISGTLGEIQLGGSDVEGDALAFALSSRPSSGTAVVIKVGDKWLLRYQSKVGFSGTDTLSFIARDGKLNSAPATITITVRPNNAPLLLSVLPNRGSFPAGSTVVFEQKVRDLDGTAHLDAAALLIGNSPTAASARGGATLWFDAQSNLFTLTKDDGTLTFAPVTLGQTLENSQVKVTLGAGDVARSSTGILTLRWRVTFKPGFLGTKSLWSRVEDMGSLSAGFTKSGDITLVSPVRSIQAAPSSSAPTS